MMMTKLQLMTSYTVAISNKGRFLLRKNNRRTGSRNKIEPAHGLSEPIFCSNLNLWSATRMIKSWSIFNFGPAVRIIQDGKDPLRSLFSWVKTGINKLNCWNLVTNAYHVYCALSCCMKYQRNPFNLPSNSEGRAYRLLLSGTTWMFYSMLHA